MNKIRIAMKNSVYISFFLFVTILSIFSVYSALYYKKLDANIYEKYLPKIRIYPQYDIKTGKVDNKDKVTVWKESDFVPWYGIVSHKIAFFMKTLGFGFFLLALLFYIPILLYILLFDMKMKPIVYLIILTTELVACFYSFDYYLLYLID